MKRNNTSVQNLLNAKRVTNIHSNSFNSSVSGSSSKASFKENCNSLNKTKKIEKIEKKVVSKPGISERDNSLLKRKQNPEYRVQQKYPFEEKYTII